MAGITQTIPNFFQGISSQPDDLKIPGQVTNSVNFLPDITKGLIKRPGSRLVKQLDSDATSNGCWFTFINDTTSEKYIGKVARNGHVHIWNCADGTKETITDGATYLTHSADGDIQFLQVSDHIHVVNRLKSPNFTKSGTGNTDAYTNVGPHSIGNGNECFIDFKLLASARQYALDVYTDGASHNIDFYTATSLEVHTEFEINEHAANPKHKTFPSHTRAAMSGIDQNSQHNGNDPPHLHAHVFDASCPDISTRLWSSNHAPPGNSAPSNQNGIVSIKNSSGSDVSSQRHKLWWRFTVKGFSGARSDVDEVKRSDDYTCQYSYDCDLLHGGHGWRTGDVVEFKQEGIVYKIKVKSHVVSRIRADVKVIRPNPTPFDKDTAINKDAVIGEVRDILDSTNNNGVSLDAEVIGNGIYVKSNNSFNIETGHKDLMNIVTNRVNTVADLPTQCKAGFIVRVVNSEDNVDDYWLQFRGKGCSEDITEQGSPSENATGGYGVDGPGTWVECVKPEAPMVWDAATMPHRIKRTALNTFAIDQPEWAKRTIGSGINFTNKAPSIYKRVNITGRTDAEGSIKAMAFWRNRLVFLTDTTIVMSQPGDYYNLWNKTALAVSPVDRVDIAVSTTFPADITSAIEVPAGLVLFSANQQFLVTTDSELVTPETVRSNVLCTYNYNVNTKPVDLGTTIGFLDNAESNSRFFEVVDIRREVPPTVIDQSQVVSGLLPANVESITSSRENGLVLISNRGANTIFGLKYFGIGKERLQQAWFRWKLNDEVQHHAIIDDSYYVIFQNNNLVEFNLKADTRIRHELPGNSNPLEYSIVKSNTQFSLHLDNTTAYQKDHTEAAKRLTYDAATNKTTFTLTTGTPSTDLVGIVYGNDGSGGSTDDSGDLLGRYAEVTQVSGSTYSLPGNWTETSVGGSTVKPFVLIGNLFESSVEFPRFYVSKTQEKKTKTDVTASLTLHRAHLNLGPSGKYSTLLQRLGRPDYTNTYISTLADSYLLNDPALLPSKLDTVPIYDRNVNTKLFLISKHPSPLTVNSLTWEGDYTPNFYRRV